MVYIAAHTPAAYTRGQHSAMHTSTKTTEHAYADNKAGNVSKDPSDIATGAPDTASGLPVLVSQRRSIVKTAAYSTFLLFSIVYTLYTWYKMCQDIKGQWPYFGNSSYNDDEQTESSVLDLFISVCKYKKFYNGLVPGLFSFYHVYLGALVLMHKYDSKMSRHVSFLNYYHIFICCIAALFFFCTNYIFNPISALSVNFSMAIFLYQIDLAFKDPAGPFGQTLLPVSYTVERTYV